MTSKTADNSRPWERWEDNSGTLEEALRENPGSLIELEDSVLNKTP